jgi:2-dehydro-3-deoxyphosphooctonate aldolase (KDO 8-P synthase)
MSSINLNNFNIGNYEPMTLMGGVNVLESDSVVMNVAEKFAESTKDLNINWIFKGSYDKANRSSISSFRGPGIEEGLRMLEKVKSEFNVPVITDIHEPSQAEQVAEVSDVIQIPAFLCRQTLICNRDEKCH